MASQQNHRYEPEKQKEQIIKIQEGRELNLNVSTDISCERSFMYPAYHQAELAASEILKQTKCFHEYIKDCDYDGFASEQLDDLLFQYSGNIIAFVAPKGGGKTHTMLSFARCLRSKGTDLECLAPTGNCKCGDRTASGRTGRSPVFENHMFITCTPISPATLEGNQSILYVILSRLYNLAENLLEDDVRNRRISEAKKSKLYTAFRQCLSGINGIKSTQSSQSDFSTLRELGDGLSLQRRFYELVQIILEIAAPKYESGKRYLVLQLDDTDSQVKNGYAVFEDVRKYLLIPNLIILISTDLDLMHNVILESHLSQHKTLLNTDKKDYLVADLNRATRKYIDKLIPPSHMVHLPQLYKVMENHNSHLLLQYVNDSGKPVFDWMKARKNWDLQDAVLSLIYRKTGILFVVPATYLHNIIPHTMRGLNQLLYLLKAMENDLEPLKEENFVNSNLFAKAILEQKSIAEDNLSRFTEYFVGTWVKAKIRNIKDAEFLKNFYESSANNRVRLAIQHLCEKYGRHEYLYQIHNRFVLDELMADLDQDNRTQDDFLLFFAIRTLFTLETHRRIWWFKGAHAEQWLDKSHDTDEILFFDFELEQIQSSEMLRNSKYKVDILADDPNVSTKLEDPDGLYFTLQFDETVNKRFFSRLPRYSQKILMCSDGNEQNIVFNFFNCLNLPLRLAELITQHKEGPGPRLTPTQYQVYWMQELSLLIGANWDVQAKLYKEVDVFAEGNPQDEGQKNGGKISSLFSSVYGMVKDLNNDMLKFVSPELWTILTAPEKIYTVFKDLMEESMEDFERLKTALSCVSTSDEILDWLSEPARSSPVLELGPSTEKPSIKVTVDETEISVFEEILQNEYETIKSMINSLRRKYDELDKLLTDAEGFKASTESDASIPQKTFAQFRERLNSLCEDVGIEEGRLDNLTQIPKEEQLRVIHNINDSLRVIISNFSDLSERIHIVLSINKSPEQS